MKEVVSFQNAATRYSDTIAARAAGMKTRSTSASSLALMTKITSTTAAQHMWSQHMGSQTQKRKMLLKCAITTVRREGFHSASRMSGSRKLQSRTLEMGLVSTAPA
ncbi:hypothetical protein Ctob_012197 [Chrysochromulina tobinii]|uniref:Uncharacterized protein n=1 Tax=Chrysochromulina tobinii TaxID=1460289 RepID=A0A0M0JFE3_9EUKA|nr:hypothetical protein Ctob_012197 [Chrysochromulina tobinii]|eukprot:KOO25077.1 hypothetical protein Ctob_012197 [Chrysochromulina sp. CCMP291]